MTMLMTGVHTALATPFESSGKLDFASFEKLLQHQLQAQIDGWVVFGTTGESPTLTSDEKKKLLEFCIQTRKKQPVLIIAGTGTNDTYSTIEHSQQAVDIGADALLIVTPYYNKPLQDGLIKHYLSVADAVEKPILLYNVPGRTQVCLTPATVAKLAEHPRIIGIKEASGNLNLFLEMKQAVARVRQDFLYLSGDDPTFWPFMACGGHGIISVASNVIPIEIKKIHDSSIHNDFKAGLQLFEKAHDLLQKLFIETNPLPVKALLHEQKIFNSPGCRSPLTELSPATQKILLQSWKIWSQQ